MLATQLNDQESAGIISARFVRKETRGCRRHTPSATRAATLDMEPESEGYDPYDHVPVIRAPEGVQAK
jgi:hypothetical protein